MFDIQYSRCAGSCGRFIQWPHPLSNSNAIINTTVVIDGKTYCGDCGKELLEKAGTVRSYEVRKLKVED